MMQRESSILIAPCYWHGQRIDRIDRPVGEGLHGGIQPVDFLDEFLHDGLSETEMK
jgi:hypothetical protein